MADPDGNRSPNCDQVQIERGRTTVDRKIVKQKLSAYVHRHRKRNSVESTANEETQDVDNTSWLDQPAAPVLSESIKTESAEGSTNRTDAETESESGHQSAAPCGSFLAGSLILSNSILDEVLNEKKLALLQSSEVITFLKEKQKCCEESQQSES